jgi:RNase P subunit RPR2
MDNRPLKPQGKDGRRDNNQRRGRKGRRTKDMVGIARERMDLLMDQAIRSLHSGDITKANRYAGLARSIGMRYNVRMRLDHRQMVCRKCGALLVPSKTSSVRIVRGRRISHCLKCGDIRRVTIKARTGPINSTVSRARSDEVISDEKNDEATVDDQIDDDVD